MKYKKVSPLVGAWKLLEMKIVKNKVTYEETKLFTRRAADVIEDKESNKKYIRGQWCFEPKNPSLIEQIQRYNFVYTQTRTLSEKDYLRELFASSLLK